MKATLMFNLPDDRPEFEIANSAGALHTALLDVERHLRDRLKHAELSKEARAELEAIRELIPYGLLDRL